MSEKKKGKQRKNIEESPTKEEYAVAKYLRFGIPVREGKLHGMEIKCFIGSVAVDKLMESKWSVTNNKKDPLFNSRLACVSYMLRLLQKGLFHRAEREKRKKDKDKEKDKPKKKKKERDGEKEEVAKPEEEAKERKGKKERKAKKDKEGETNGEDTEKTESTEKKTEKKEEKKKKEKRLKLVMPEEQFFEDGDEVYVWIYDPVNAKTFFIGLLMVLGAIGLCMFPLWPEEVRIGVYYLSLCAAGFVGFILSLVVVRLILFCCVWVLTMGKHHFWFLPNLTEDVGFFDSFKPLYHHEKATPEDKLKDEGKKKKKTKMLEDSKEKDKDSATKKEKSSDKDDSDEFEVIKKEDVADNGEDKEDEENVEDDPNGLGAAADDDDDEDNGLGPDDEEEEEEDDDDNDDEDNMDEENGESEEDEFKDEKKKTK